MFHGSGLPKLNLKLDDYFRLDFAEFKKMQRKQTSVCKGEKIIIFGKQTNKQTKLIEYIFYKIIETN